MTGASSDTRCVVCGLQLGGAQHYRGRLHGRRWHVRCHGTDTCTACDAPAAAVFHGVPRCSDCGKDTVDRPEQMNGHAQQTLRTLWRLGVRYDMEILLSLRNRDTLTRDRGRTVLGLTASSWVPSTGKSQRKVVITMLAGMPTYLFRSVLAHEMGHVVLRGLDVNNLPDAKEEGFAEYLSYAYNVESGTPEGRFLAEQLMRNSDPVYGGGLRTYAQAVAREGFRPAFVALVKEGRGLAPVSLSGGREKTKCGRCELGPAVPSTLARRWP